MLFKEALDNLIGGQYVYRQAWSAEGSYLVALPNLLVIWKITPMRGVAIDWVPTIADLNADDWNVLVSTI